MEVLLWRCVVDQLLEERDALREDVVEHYDETTVEALFVSFDEPLPLIPARVFGVVERGLARELYARVR